MATFQGQSILSDQKPEDSSNCITFCDQQNVQFFIWGNLYTVKGLRFIVTHWEGNMELIWKMRIQNSNFLNLFYILLILLTHLNNANKWSCTGTLLWIELFLFWVFSWGCRVFTPLCSLFWDGRFIDWVHRVFRGFRRSLHRRFVRVCRIWAVWANRLNIS